MSFGAAARRSTKQDARVRMQSALEQQDSVGEHAAVEQWEQELMRSGAATKKGQYVPRGRSKLPSSIGGGGGGSGSGSAAGNHNGGEMLAPEVAVEQLHRRLSGILTSLEEVHRSQFPVCFFLPFSERTEKKEREGSVQGAFLVGGERGLQTTASNWVDSRAAYAC